jgi:hypothetical protein
MDAQRGWELPQPVSPDHRFGIGQAFAVAVEEERPALAPGVVVAHDRNERSNGALRAHGIALLTFPRGGARPRPRPSALHQLPLNRDSPSPR